MPNDIYTDPAIMATIINETDVPVETVFAAAAESDPYLAGLLRDKPMMDAIVTWTSNTRGGSARSRAGGLFDRDRFVCPENPFEQMKVASDAANDDVVSSFLDSSEALAFSNIQMEVDDEDEQDIWAQICDDIDLDDKMRAIWRDLNIYSQCYVATWFGTKSYKVRGKSVAGKARKKTFNDLLVPLGIATLDPLKVVPCGNYLFGRETLTYFADPTERDVIDSWLLGDDDSGADEIIKRLIIGKYQPDFRDRKEIGNLGVDPNRLYVLNPKYVWRHTLTRPSYERFAPVHMRSVFELLDLKQQLKASDRATLIGAANFIVLIKKGDDKSPAKQFEIQALQESARTLSKVPVIVGDHRLNIEIITPKVDHTIDETRYGTLDLRISGRLYGMFITTHAGRDDSLKLARVVAKGLESKRMMQRRAFMDKVFTPTFEFNAALTAQPNMVFHPKRISLDFDPSMATYLLDLRDRGDLSRASVLSEVDYDEGDEAAKRQMEIEKYDHIFQPPMPLPGAAAPAGGAGVAPGAPNSPKRAGKALGGNHGQGGNGGKGRGAGQEPRAGSRSASKGIVGQPKLNKNDTGTSDND